MLLRLQLVRGNGTACVPRMGALSCRLALIQLMPLRLQLARGNGTACVPRMGARSCRLALIQLILLRLRLARGNGTACVPRMGALSSCYLWWLLRESNNAARVGSWLFAGLCPGPHQGSALDPRRAFGPFETRLAIELYPFPISLPRVCAFWGCAFFLLIISY